MGRFILGAVLFLAGCYAISWSKTLDNIDQDMRAGNIDTARRGVRHLRTEHMEDDREQTRLDVYDATLNGRDVPSACGVAEKEIAAHPEVLGTERGMVSPDDVARMRRRCAMPKNTTHRQADPGSDPDYGFPMP